LTDHANPLWQVFVEENRRPYTLPVTGIPIRYIAQVVEIALINRMDDDDPNMPLQPGGGARYGQIGVAIRHGVLLSTRGSSGNA
jgi:hypothetical protein